MHISRSIALLLAAATFAVPAFATPAEAPNPLFTGRDLFDLSSASDAQISPDGRSVAYVRRTADIMTDRVRQSIWLINVATGEQRPVAAGTGDHFSPRWSPDGRRLAYASTAEGGGPQLFVRWMDTGQTVRVTALPDSPQGIAWSPDGTRLAYLMNVPDEAPKLGAAPPKPEGANWAKPLEVIDKVTYRADGAGYIKAGFDHIFLVDANGGAPRQLTFGAFHDGAPEWAPDGRSIVFSAIRKPDWEMTVVDSEVYRLDLDGGTITALTSRNGPDQNPVVSPDGRSIAFTGYDDHKKGYEQSSLYVMPITGGTPRLVSGNLDRDIARIEWSADGRALYAAYEDGGSVTISRIGLDGSVRPLTREAADSGYDRPYAGGGFSVARSGTIAFTTSPYNRPTDVAIAGSATRQLTHLNELTLGAKNLGTLRTLDVAAPDGGRVPSWILLPPTYGEGQRVPLILEIHGGPYAAYGPHFSTDYQQYAAAGYAVLFTNPRGSTGYGQAFADGIEKTYPDSDYADLMAAVDAAVASGVADPDNLFVTGGSGGGILTAWIIGKTNRFKAAAAQKPVINWVSQSLTSDGTPFYGPYWIGALPWENVQAYWSRSPLSLIQNVKTPTLVVVGTEDYRTPVSEAEQLYSALKLQRVPTMLVKVPDASHGGITARPSQSAAKASAIIAWFDRYRKKPGATTAAAEGASATPAQ